MRIATLALLAAALVDPAAAGQATATYEDSAGGVRIHVTITDPAGEVGIDRFESMNFSTRLAGTVERRGLPLSAESRASCPTRGVASARGGAQGGEDLIVD